jgi:hypothetical protein
MFSMLSFGHELPLLASRSDDRDFRPLFDEELADISPDISAIPVTIATLSLESHIVLQKITFSAVIADAGKTSIARISATHPCRHAILSVMPTSRAWRVE